MSKGAVFLLFFNENITLGLTFLSVLQILDKDPSFCILCPFYWDTEYFSLPLVLYRVFHARRTNLKVQTAWVIVDLVDDVRDLNISGIVAAPPHCRLSGIKLSSTFTSDDEFSKPGDCCRRSCHCDSNQRNWKLLDTLAYCLPAKYLNLYKHFLPLFGPKYKKPFKVLNREVNWSTHFM